MNPLDQYNLLTTRRQFFGDVGLRFGGLALAMLMGQTHSAARASTAINSTRVHPPLPGFPHHPPRARSLIYLHMNGGPSQMDLWDYKPRLKEFFDKELPPSIQNGQRLSTMTSGQSRFPVAPSKYKFEQKGQSGRWINTELLP